MKISKLKTLVWKGLKPMLMHRALLHVVFWTLIFIQVLTYSSGNGEGLSAQKIFKAFLIIGFYAFPVLFDSFFLVEYYFKKAKYGLYFACLVLLLCINSFIAVHALRDLASVYILFIQHLFSSCGFLMIVGIVRVYQYNLKQQVQFQELQSMQVQSELSVLKSQIHPHFLFNTLNSLYALALDRSEKTAEVVLRLSDLMRYILHESQAPYVPLSCEIDYLQNYLWLEQLRLGSRADVILKVHGDTTKCIAPLLFLPFVENSFKHGVDQSTGKVFVRMQMHIDDKGLCFKIENSKPTTKNHSPLDRELGIGLANVERRLIILYPGKHHLQREVNPDVYCVTLHLHW